MMVWTRHGKGAELVVLVKELMTTLSAGGGAGGGIFCELEVEES